MKSRTLRYILLAAACSVFLFSSFMVLKHQLETLASEKYTTAITEMVVTPMPAPSPIRSEEENTDDAPVAKSEETHDEASADHAPDQPEETLAEEPIVVPIQVDFDALRAANQDVVAWIYCPDTPINYPIVQASDNEYYLRRLLDGTTNTYGTLFMDYRNDDDFSDWNSIIYGHNIHDDLMFGSLLNYESRSYFRAHPIIFLLTPEQNYAIKIMAGFLESPNSALYNALNASETEKGQLYAHWYDASDFVSGIVPEKTDRLVTLSTCSYVYNNARYVLIGVLEEVNN